MSKETLGDFLNKNINESKGLLGYSWEGYLYELEDFYKELRKVKKGVKVVKDNDDAGDYIGLSLGKDFILKFYEDDMEFVSQISKADFYKVLRGQNKKSILQSITESFQEDFSEDSIVELVIKSYKKQFKAFLSYKKHKDFSKLRKAMEKIVRDDKIEFDFSLFQDLEKRNNVDEIQSVLFDVDAIEFVLLNLGDNSNPQTLMNKVDYIAQKLDFFK